MLETIQSDSSQSEHLYNGSSLSYSVLCLNRYVYLFGWLFGWLLKEENNKTNVPLLFQLLSLEMSSNQTKPMFLLRRVQVLHYPVFLLTLALQIISTGTVSMEDQNLNFLYSPTTLQKKLSSLLKIQDSLLMWQKGNMWIWRSPLLLYQTLLCTTVLCSPQWQETHQLSTKTCYSERQER